MAKSKKEAPSKTAFIRERLYVPEKYVKSKHLDAFTTVIEDFYGKSDSDDPEMATDFSLTIKGYTYMPAKGMYAFDLGLRNTINKMFDGFEFIDERAVNKLKNWKVKMNDDFSLRPHQEKAVRKWLDKKYGLINMPARGGKTVTMVHITTQLAVKTLIVAPQIELLEQWESEFRRFTNCDEVEAKEKRKVIGILKKWSDIDKYDIVLSSWQLWNLNPDKLKKYRKTFGLFFMDEIHRGNAACPAKVVRNFAARYRGGVTATVERKDGLDKVIRYILGPVTAKVNVEQLPCKVQKVTTQVDPGPIQMWARMENKLVAHKGRNELIARLIKQDVIDGHSVVAVTTRVGHCDTIVELLEKEGIPAETFNSKQRDRKGVLERAKSGKTKVVVAMRSMLLGINVPLWSSLHATMPSNNPPNFYQEYSRVRTPNDNKIQLNSKGVIVKRGIFPKIVDYVDNHKALMGCFYTRNRLYQKEGFHFLKGVDAEEALSSKQKDYEPELQSSPKSGKSWASIAERNRARKSKKQEVFELSKKERVKKTSSSSVKKAFDI